MQKPSQDRQLRILAQLQHDPALSIVGLWGPRGDASGQNVLLDVWGQADVDSVRFVDVGECFAADSQFKVVLVAVEGFDSWNEKHFAHGYFEKTQDNDDNV